MQIQSIVLVVKINTQIHLNTLLTFTNIISLISNTILHDSTLSTNMIMTNFYDTRIIFKFKISAFVYREMLTSFATPTQEARTIAREPFHSIADVRLWWRNATTRSAIHHRAVMSHAVYPVKWIQSTLGGDVTDERRGGRQRHRDTR